MSSTASGSGDTGAPLDVEHVYLQLCGDMEQYVKMMQKCVEVGLMGEKLVKMQEFILKNLYLEAHARIPAAPRGSLSVLEKEACTRESLFKRKAEQVAQEDMAYRNSRQIVQISKALEEEEEEEPPRWRRGTLVRVGAPRRDAASSQDPSTASQVATPTVAIEVATYTIDADGDSQIPN